MKETPLCGRSLTGGVGESHPLNNWHGGSLTRLVGDLLEDFVDALSPVGALSSGNWLYIVS